MSSMKTIDTLLFDLDGTLYPAENGYQDHCHNRIFNFMQERLGVESLEKAKSLWWDMFQKYNQVSCDITSNALHVPWVPL
jgi:putative hydrolase of the HAD superfamily